jgi:hypothetical protein
MMRELDDPTSSAADLDPDTDLYHDPELDGDLGTEDDDLDMPVEIGEEALEMDESHYEEISESEGKMSGTKSVMDCHFRRLILAAMP